MLIWGDCNASLHQRCGAWVPRYFNRKSMVAPGAGVHREWPHSNDIDDSSITAIVHGKLGGRLQEVVLISMVAGFKPSALAVSWILPGSLVD